MYKKKGKPCKIFTHAHPDKAWSTVSCERGLYVATSPDKAPGSVSKWQYLSNRPKRMGEGETHMGRAGWRPFWRRGGLSFSIWWGKWAVARWRSLRLAATGAGRKAALRLERLEARRFFGRWCLLSWRWWVGGGRGPWR